MLAGQLKKRIVVEVPTENQDSFGEPIKTWNTYIETWAQIIQLNGSEYIEQKQINVDIDTRIKIRYINGITEKMRIIYNSRIFHIKSVINIEERGKEMLLYCQEKK
jgi:SPP1 family predicted phage head-tail adaptor